VAHYFKHNKPRNFEVTWDLYDVNLFRFALTYFSDRRLAAVIGAAKERPNFTRSLEASLGEAGAWERLRQLHRRFRRDEGWFFRRFSREFERFEGRVRELTPAWDPAPGRDFSPHAEALATALADPDCGGLQSELDRLRYDNALAPAFAELVECGALSFTDAGEMAPRFRAWPTRGLRAEGMLPGRWTDESEEGLTMVTQRRQVCGNCGATNVGAQNKCMLCGAALPEGVAETPWQAQPAASPPTPTPPAVPAASACANCGASLEAGAKFCVRCGSAVTIAATPQAAAPAAPTPVACRNCGAALAADARFCISCGTPRA
jgi:RNA polymerase subunit RPABC4/transcription elongation factor Spt4